MVKWDIYRAEDGWRWRAWRGANIVADSGEAYSSRAKCRRAVANLVLAIGGSHVNWGRPKPATKRRPA